MAVEGQAVAAGRRRVLLTGAGGFLGANLLRRLVGDGHEVTGVLRPGGDRWRVAGMDGDAELVELDLRDEEQVRRLVLGVSPDWTFHLAAHGAYSWQTNTRRIVGTNLVATVGLVDACREAGVGAFVHAGSSSEYGYKDHAPSEDEPLEPNSRYAVAKAAATMFCRYAAREGVPAVSLRLYSVYGPYEDPRRFVPTLVAHGLRNRLPPLVRPDVARDFVWVGDVVDAFVLAAGAAGGRAGAVYNVGSGVQTSVREAVEVARRVLGIDAEPQWGSMPDRAWDTASWVADCRLARRELGWEAQTGLGEGLERTAAWLRDRRPLMELYDIPR
jgi:dolichol-phosphate mannosyltransferase